MDEIRVLMVCMGNICRSPMAEAVMWHRLALEGLGSSVFVDSAGTHSYHLGQPPHPGTRAELERRGVAVGHQESRLVVPADFEEFDYIVAMDRENLAGLRAMAHAAGGIDGVRAELSLLLEHAAEIPVDDVVDEVPDPYYVGGYDVVYELVDAGCAGLLERVRGRLDGPGGPA